LAVELAGDQLACDRQVQAVRDREGLGSADRMPVVAGRHGVCEHLTVSADLDERGADRAQPCKRL
jgi:hypothetical protein